MKKSYRVVSIAFLAALASMLPGQALLAATPAAPAAQAPPVPEKWPPALPTANANGTATISGVELLQVPPSVQKVLDTNPKAVRFTLAKAPPEVELAYHRDLPDAALNGTGWSAWGDICLAADGKVYVGLGNHGGIEKGKCYLYCWDPQTSTLKQVADFNDILGVTPEDVHWSKTHAGIFEGNDHKIYVTCTLDDGGLADREQMRGKWTHRVPGGQIFQYDPDTGRTIVFADFPTHLVTATTYFDAMHNILYCCLEGNAAGVALGAFDMGTKEWIYQSPFGVVAFDRKIALDSDGNVYFNGKEDPSLWAQRYNEANSLIEADYRVAKAKALAAKQPAPPKPKPTLVEGSTIWKYDAATHAITPTRSSFTDAGMRSATRQAKDGNIYGTTMGGDLFSYNPAKDKLRLLGKDFLTGEYVTVCDLSPDDRYVYYLPGAHGSAGLSGTPVMQYDVENQRQKALGFLYEPMARKFNYWPGGTYGMKISKDGSTMYVNLNGSLPDALRPKGIGNEFGLTSFAAIHIPSSERGE